VPGILRADAEVEQAVASIADEEDSQVNLRDFITVALVISNLLIWLILWHIVVHPLIHLRPNGGNVSLVIETPLPDLAHADGHVGADAIGH